ncbi:putative copper chaperone SCO1/SenC, Thioredoxin-like superfamily [Helianthus anomalus]
MMFHSSSYMRATQRSNKNGRLLDKGREQLASSSSWRSYLLPIGVLGGIGGGYLFMRSYDEKRTPRRGEGRNDGRSARKAPVIGGPFSLIGSDGRLVTEKDLQGGDWILIYFGYTASPDVGPAELAKLAKQPLTFFLCFCFFILTQKDSEHNITIRPVFVTIDPQRDTPSHLRAYLKGQFSFHPYKLYL